MNLLLVLALLTQAFQGPFVSDRVQVGGVTVALTLTDPATGLSVPLLGAAVCAMEPATDPPGDKIDTLTTTVKDPENPEEPTTCTSTRGSNESMGDFLRRHRELVAAVRKAFARKG